MEITVHCHPAGMGWFICYDGLQDTDAGYFRTEADALDYISGQVLECDDE